MKELFILLSSQSDYNIVCGRLKRGVLGSSECEKPVVSLLTVAQMKSASLSDSS